MTATVHLTSTESGRTRLHPCASIRDSSSREQRRANMASICRLPCRVVRVRDSTRTHLAPSVPSLQARNQSVSVAPAAAPCKMAMLAPPSSRRALQPRLVKTAAAAASAGDASQHPVPAAATAGSSSFVQAVFNCVNVMMGVGLLTLPFALKSSGWIGIGLLWLMCIICNYTGKALVQCSQAVAKRRNVAPASIGYEEIAEETFGKLGRLVISAIIYTELFGTCCLLFILEGDNLFNILGTSFLKNASVYMLAGAAVMIPTVWLPDLSALSYLGFLGVTATTFVVASVGYTLLTGNFPPGAVTDTALWATLPLVFGIMTFCYSGHGVFPAIQASMKNPEEFPKVLDVAYLIVGTLCTFIGAAGYYMYGPAAADIIIFNLPAGLLATICSCLVLVNPIAKFALTMEPIAVAGAKASGATSGIPRLLLRTALAFAILAAARSLPFLATVMALVGSFMTVSVSVTFPALCHQLLYNDQLTGSQSAWNYFVATLGITCTIFGTTASMKSLAAKAASAAVGA